MSFWKDCKINCLNILLFNDVFKFEFESDILKKLKNKKVKGMVLWGDNCMVLFKNKFLFIYDNMICLVNII